MIIDVHAHVWPDHIASQVVAGSPAGLTPVFDGRVSTLLRTMDRNVIDRAGALGVATRGRTVHRTNEFLGGLDRSRLIPFGTVHPDLSVEENLASLSDHGIRAVKFHPNFQGVALNDPRVVELMRALADSGVIVLAHVGAGDDEAATRRGAPHGALELVSAVPDLTLIACHFGGYHLLGDSERELVGKRLLLETSWPPSVDALEANRVRQLIQSHGADRIVFGTDWPMADPARELAAVRSWGLDPADEAAILGQTISKLLDGAG
jgi:uncharacterized protein